MRPPSKSRPSAPGSLRRAGAPSCLSARAQMASGAWARPTPEWVTLQTLLLLRDMGLDPGSEPAWRAVARVRDNVRWQGVLPQDAAWHDRPLFAGEVEPCINGRVV